MKILFIDGDPLSDFSIINLFYELKEIKVEPEFGLIRTLSDIRELLTSNQPIQPISPNNPYKQLLKIKPEDLERICRNPDLIVTDPIFPVGDEDVSKWNKAFPEYQIPEPQSGGLIYSCKIGLEIVLPMIRKKFPKTPVIIWTNLSYRILRSQEFVQFTKTLEIFKKPYLDILIRHIQSIR